MQPEDTFVYDASSGCCFHVLRLNKICSMCEQGVLGDEKHLVCECPAMRDLRGRYEHLFQTPRSDGMFLFIGQDDIIGVAVC